MLAVIMVSFAALPASGAETDNAPHLVVRSAVVGPSTVTLGVTFVSGPADPLGSSPKVETFSAFEAGKEKPDTTRRIGGDDLEVGIVVDTNPGGLDLEQVKNSIRSLVNGLPEGTRISLTEASLTPVAYVESTPDRSVVLAAVDVLGRGTGTDIPEAMNAALDGFSGRKGTFRNVVLFANRYNARTDVTKLLADRIKAQEISTYLVTPDRTLAGTIAASFPLPFGGGRRIVAVGNNLADTGTMLGNELSHQYEVVIPTEKETFEAGIEVRASWRGETLSAVTIVQLKPHPKPDLLGKNPDAGNPMDIVRLLGVLAVAAAVLYIPPRMRRAFARSRRSGPALSVGIPVVEGASTLSQALPETPWTLDGPIRGSEADWSFVTADRTSSLGGDRVEGRQAVHELLRAQTRRTRGVWLVEGIEDPETDELAEASHVPVRRVDAHTFQSVAGSAEPEGVMGFAEPLTSVSVDDLSVPGHVPSTVMVIDCPVDDHASFAALLRAAVTAGAHGVVFARSQAVALPPMTTSLAAGAVEHLRFVGVGNLAPAVTRLRALGFMLIAVDPGAVVSLDELHRGVGLATAPIALVAGTQGPTDRRLAARCDVTVRVHRPGEDEAGNSIGEWACWELGQLRLPAGVTADGAV